MERAASLVSRSKRSSGGLSSNPLARTAPSLSGETRDEEESIGTSGYRPVQVTNEIIEPDPNVPSPPIEVQFLSV
jgi:hypothetical protein